jgi:hypothetical protein
LANIPASRNRVRVPNMENLAPGAQTNLPGSLVLFSNRTFGRVQLSRAAFGDAHLLE